ncbi:transposase [Streptomyces sp. NPDC002589]|uniref:transposase n=1 Tax=Streptomyces sp. NPDC002589 TaxID=3154420 RepID=UPI00331B8B8E
MGNRPSVSITSRGSMGRARCGWPAPCSQRGEAWRVLEVSPQRIGRTAVAAGSAVSGIPDSRRRSHCVLRLSLIESSAPSLTRHFRCCFGVTSAPGVGVQAHLAVPVIVADAGYGRSVSFRLALEERGWSYVVAVDPKEIARPADAEPYHPAYGGLGPPTLPRYRDRPRSLPGLVDDATVFEEVTWRQGSKGAMTSHFAVLQVRPSGKEACRTAQEQAGELSRARGRTCQGQARRSASFLGLWTTRRPPVRPRRARLPRRVGPGHSGAALRPDRDDAVSRCCS